MGEQDAKISLLQRVVEHALNTARYSIFYGEGRDAYDMRGRTAHEAVFNTVSGVFRCPNSQQGYAPFSTWTRGLAWAICGFAEQLEFLRGCARQSAADFKPAGGLAAFTHVLTDAAMATADFYFEHSCADGVPMWDTARRICIAYTQAISISLPILTIGSNQSTVRQRRSLRKV